MDFQLIIILGAIGLLAHWFNKNNSTTKKQIVIAAIISFVWVYFSGLYGYRGSNYDLYGLNLFAFFAWTTGLVILNKWYLSIKWKENKFA